MTENLNLPETTTQEEEVTLVDKMRDNMGK
jgi:hypothetical protein